MDLLLILIFFLAGICASLGLGGGFILLIYLSIFSNISQQQAQLINLIFFIPIGLFSLFFHKKNNLIEKKMTLSIILFGIIGVFIGFGLSFFLSSKILLKIFSLFIFFIGIKQIFPKKNNLNKKD